jgi:hypothetical protein
METPTNPDQPPRLALDALQIAERVHALEDQLEVPRHSFVVIGGAALAMFDIKLAGDIDVSASKKVMDRVHSRLETEQREGVCGTVLDVHNEFELANGWGKWSHAYVRQNSIIHRDVAMMRLARVVDWKVTHERPRDTDDIIAAVHHAHELQRTGRNMAHMLFVVMNRFSTSTTCHIDLWDSHHRHGV